MKSSTATDVAMPGSLERLVSRRKENMKLTPTQIVATNERQSCIMPEGCRIVDAQIARTLAAELEEWMSRCKHVEEVNNTLRLRNISLMDERDGAQQQMAGLRREVEHQKARVKAYADETDQERSNRVAACRTLTADCNLRGKYIRQLREAIIKLPAPCSCDMGYNPVKLQFGHDENCPANIKSEALKLKDDIAEPANVRVSESGGENQKL